MTKKISIVHRRIQHHAAHSGYNTIFEYMGLAHADGGVLSWLASHIPRAIRWRLHILRPQDVDDEGLIPELKALSTTASSTPGICHFIYGEDTYFYTPLWQNKNKDIVATYHYPPDRLSERVNRAILPHLSAIILMSESQRPWFEQYVPSEKLHVIHHHVNTDFFTPITHEKPATPIRIMSVGGILRDTVLLLEVAKELTKTFGESNIEFDLLMNPSANKELSEMPNVKFHSSISDEALRSLYQNCDVGFMPLLDCTANNAVLEMMACGKAIVSTDVGGISDYLDDAGAILIPTESTACEVSSSIAQLLNNTPLISSMGQHNRHRAETEFSLPATAKKLQRLYSTL